MCDHTPCLTVAMFYTAVIAYVTIFQTKPRQAQLGYKHHFFTQGAYGSCGQSVPAGFSVWK